MFLTVYIPHVTELYAGAVCSVLTELAALNDFMLFKLLVFFVRVASTKEIYWKRLTSSW